MDKKSITHPGGSRKCETGTGPPGAARFTPEELAELAAFDAAVDEKEDMLTKEERRLSLALDREALAETADRSAASRSPSPEGKAGRKGYDAAYYRAHRAERLEYQRCYDAAHREEINAKRRAKYAAEKKRRKHG